MILEPRAWRAVSAFMVRSVLDVMSAMVLKTLEDAAASLGDVYTTFFPRDPAQLSVNSILPGCCTRR